MIPCYQICKNRGCPNWTQELMDCDRLPDDCEYVIEHLLDERENQFLEGELHGCWSFWCNQLFIDGIYVNGEREGLWMFRYSNGQLAMEGKYKTGELDGMWRFWNKDGEREEDEVYADGVKQ